MTVLVTGATGLLGNNLTRLLLDQGEQVRVLVRQEKLTRPLTGLDVELMPGDVRDLDSLQHAIRGVSAVYHCAALVVIGWRDMQASREVNVEGSLNVALAARQQNARMIHVSSIDALGLGTKQNPVTEETPYRPHVQSPYPVTKREAEVALLQMAREGLDLVILNPGFMLGPWDWRPSSGRMLLEVAAGKTVVAPAGHNQFCGAQEVAKAAITACQRASSGERYILTGELLTYYQAFSLFAEVTGARKPWFPVGPVNLWIGGKFGDLKAKLTGKETDVNSAATAMTRLPRYFSHAKATTELDYHPRPVRESAQLAWEWFVEHGYAGE